MTLTVAIQDYDQAYDPTQVPAQELSDDTYRQDLAGDVTAGMTEGFGGFLVFGEPPAGSNDPPTIVNDPDFGEAVKPASGQGFLWMPGAEFLSGDSGRFGAWVKADADWSTLNNQIITGLGSSDAGQYVRLAIDDGDILLSIAHGENPAVPDLYTAGAFTPTIGGHAYTAGEAVRVDGLITPDGTLTLYLNGVQAAQTTGVVLPSCWGDTARSDGFTIAGGDGVTSTHLTVGGVTYERLPRIPGVRHLIGKRRSVLTVSATTTGKTVEMLPAVLHVFPDDAAHAPLAASTVRQNTLKGVRMVRSAGFVTGTPMKSGGTDGSHPTLGASGDYSYDWQVVDRFGRLDLRLDDGLRLRLVFEFG